MARRRYRSDAISTAGQAAQPRDPTGDESLQQPIQPRSEYGKSPPEGAPEPAQHYSTGLKEFVQQQRAQQQQVDPLDQYLNYYFQGALPAERQWLRDRTQDRPHYFANPMLVHEAGRLALQDGVPRESPQFVAAIGKKLDDHFAAMQAQAAPGPTPTVPPPMPPPVAHHVDLEQTEHHHEPDDEEHMAAAMISAPVSREPGHGSVEPDLSLSSIRLSPEQREVARLSMKHLSADEAEKTYAKNLLELERKQRSGLHK
jgi:hypothetical protein